MAKLSYHLRYEIENAMLDEDWRINAHLDVKVVKVHWPIIDDTARKWPGRGKFVGMYYELANGILVGENDHPFIGTTWPVVKKPKDW